MKKTNTILADIFEFSLIRFNESNAVTKSVGPAEAHEQLQKPKKRLEGIYFHWTQGLPSDFYRYMSHETELFFNL